jgi:hypothetical protein
MRPPQQGHGGRRSGGGSVSLITSPPRSLAALPMLWRRPVWRIRSEILSGRLAAGARLPSSRTLAAELGIARGTVVTAFQMLAGEGYTSSAGARGTVVNVALPRVRKLRPAAELVETGERHRTVRTPPTPLLTNVSDGSDPLADVEPMAPHQICTRPFCGPSRRFRRPRTFAPESS